MFPEKLSTKKSILITFGRVKLNPLRGKTVSSDIESISELKAVGGQVERELTLAVVTISAIKQKSVKCKQESGDIISIGQKLKDCEGDRSDGNISPVDK